MRPISSLPATPSKSTWQDAAVVRPKRMSMGSVKLPRPSRSSDSRSACQAATW